MMWWVKAPPATLASHMNARTPLIYLKAAEGGPAAWALPVDEKSLFFSLPLSL